VSASGLLTHEARAGASSARRCHRAARLPTGLGAHPPAPPARRRTASRRADGPRRPSAADLLAPEGTVAFAGSRHV